ncbi:MAG TPA: hypothetical protein VKG38_10010 [Solirubrobacteraceae bacterium]|nr:hypothetical protein [Solirubrobacteraceae bacterium]
MLTPPLVNSSTEGWRAEPITGAECAMTPVETQDLVVLSPGPELAPDPPLERT